MIGTPADDVLDRTAEISEADTEASTSAPVEAAGEGAAPARASNALHKIGRGLSRAWQFLITQGFSADPAHRLSQRHRPLALSIGITFFRNSAPD